MPELNSVSLKKDAFNFHSQGTWLLRVFGYREVSGNAPLGRVALCSSVPPASLPGWASTDTGRMDGATQLPRSDEAGGAGSTLSASGFTTSA